MGYGRQIWTTRTAFGEKSIGHFSLGGKDVVTTWSRELEKCIFHIAIYGIQSLNLDSRHLSVDIMETSFGSMNLTKVVNLDSQL